MTCKPAFFFLLPLSVLFLSPICVFIPFSILLECLNMASLEYYVAISKDLLCQVREVYVSFTFFFKAFLHPFVFLPSLASAQRQDNVLLYYLMVISN